MLYAYWLPAFLFVVQTTTILAHRYIMAKQLDEMTQAAMDQYLSLLHNLGADQSNLLKRRTFLTMIMMELERIPHDGAVYGALVEEKLHMFTQPELRHFYQVTAREFFWFWSHDEERIAAMYEGRYISVNPFTITLHEDLETLHQKAREYFEAQPHPALTHYRAQVQPLKDGSARAQWACTLLYTIKDFEQEDFTYRAAVDTLLHAIENLTMKKSFLVVVRDFHQFWQDAR